MITPLSRLFYTIVEFCKLYLVAHMIFGFELKKKVYGIGLAISAAALFALSVFMTSSIPIDGSEAAAICMIIALPKKRDWGYIAMFWVALMAMDTLIVSTLLLLFPALSDLFYHPSLGLALRNGISLVLYLLLFILLERRRAVPVMLRGRSFVGYLIATNFVLGWCCSGTYMLSYQYSIGYSPRMQRLFWIYIALLFGMLLVTLAVLLVQRKKRKRQLHEKLLLERMARDEMEYYESLMEKNDAARALRHDLRAHIIAMQTLEKNGEYEELWGYVRELKGVMG